MALFRSSRFMMLSSALVAGASLQSCGGVKKEAKIATAIQTLLANTTTALINNTGNETELTYSCGSSDDDGTLTYTIPVDLQNPLQIAQYLHDNPSGVVGLNVTFDNCHIGACGDSLVLDGGGSTIGITLGTLVAFSSASGSENSLAITISASNQAATGVMSGDLTFAYKLESVYKVDPSPQLLQLQVEDADTPTPLTIDGTTYNGANINTLADGC
jgi:hypothetical protein